MMNALLKLAASLSIIIWLKTRYKVLLFSISAILICWVAHSEYIEYLQHSGSKDGLAQSYLFKGAFTILISTWAVHRLGKPIAKSNKVITYQQPDPKKRIAMSLREPNNPKLHNDGFSQIRAKNKLQNHVDRLLEP